MIDFFIGDIHGRSDLLSKLLGFLHRHAALRDETARFTFLGDLVDRGPDSKGCVEMVIKTIERHPGSILLRGNHEEMMLDAIETNGKSELSGSWALNGGMATLESYVGRLDIPEFFSSVSKTYEAHITALKNAALYVEREGLLAVHAGIDPCLDLEDQDTEDLCWIRAPFLENINPQTRPVIHGHTIVGDLPIVTENRISIDTGAVENGKLTACIIDPDTWDISFAQSSSNRVRYVEAKRLDRGYGTLLDNPRLIFETSLQENQIKKCATPFTRTTA